MEKFVVSSARILEQRSHIVPGALKITEHFFEVPRDYASPKEGTLRLFARSAHKHNVPVESSPKDNSSEQTPYLLYLQGGPGFECRSPQAYPFTRNFLDKGYALLFLDQRGTGLSSPITAATLRQQGDAQAQARHLSLFRADNIVRDAEAVRLALTNKWPEHKSKWSLIGQSFGGYCCTTYLSLFPDSLREVFLTGGLPPVRENNPDNVYKSLIKRVIRRNEAYYDKYPEDVERVKKIARYLHQSGDGSRHGQQLPDGGILTPQRFLQLGMAFGFHGGLDGVHDTVLHASSELDQFACITRPTAASIASSGGGFDTSPIYCALHEPLYCQGNASRWSAQRLLNEHPEFHFEKTMNDPAAKTYFTGEMTFPWMLDSYSELQAMSEPIEILASKQDWPALYDLKGLAQNKVPVYAAVYTEDMYVNFEHAIDTAHTIRGCKYFLTNRVYHDGLRSKMDNVVETLWKLRTDTID